MIAPTSGPKVLTGHDDGVITMALIEADDAERDAGAPQMHEPYRTLLGHFRHEVGHYFWDVLIRDGGRLEACRAILATKPGLRRGAQAHYENGAPADWQEHYVSPMPAPIRGKTGRKPGRTTCTSSIRWRRPALWHRRASPDLPG